MEKDATDLPAPDNSAFWQNAMLWLEDPIWNDSIFLQILLLALSLALGLLVSTITKKHFLNAIDQLQTPYAIKYALRSLRRVMFSFISLIFMFIGVQIMQSSTMGKLDVSLAVEMMKVLMAWVALGICLQFIKNRLLRNIITLVIMIMLALSIFGVMDDTAETLNGIGFSIGTFRLSALALLKGVLYLSILLYLATLASKFLEGHIYRSKNLTGSSQVLIAKFVRIALIVMAVLIGLTNSGIDLSLFAVFGGAIGLGIGFGLQKGVSNLFSGMLLLMDQSIKPGDVIELPEIGTYGTVNNMAARYTEIVTRDNKSFLIPNEDFITQRVVNWSHGNSLIRVHLAFGVHYNSDPHHVTRVAIEAAIKGGRVVKDPKPVCWIVNFGESSIDFDLRFWIKDAEKGVANVRGEVFLALWDAFKAEGIEIPYPHREVFIHKPKPDND